MFSGFWNMLETVLHIITSKNYTVIAPYNIRISMWCNTTYSSVVHWVCMTEICLSESMAVGFHSIQSSCFSFSELVLKHLHYISGVCMLLFFYTSVSSETWLMKLFLTDKLIALCLYLALYILQEERFMVSVKVYMSDNLIIDGFS